MEIKQYKHGEGDFWQLMGPFFASSKIHRELESDMISDATFTWWIAMDGGRVIGFSAARIYKNGTVRLCYGYVEPEHRGEKIYRQMFDRRLADVLAWPDVTRIISVVGPVSGVPFFKAGFVEISKKGSFTEVEYRVEK